MGKATKWFRGLLGLKKPDPNQDQKTSKKRWGFVKSYREKDHHHVAEKSHNGVPTPELGESDPSKHAIAVAAATAAVAEAAVAAAHAAAAVVKLTSSGRVAAASDGGNSVAYVSRSGLGYGVREELAAVKIQSQFRAYLARRALRALKSLVKLQALVRGHIVRKQTADVLRSLQVLLRAQARARAERVVLYESPHSNTKSLQLHHPGPATPEKFEHISRAGSIKHDEPILLKRNGSRSGGKVISSQDRVQIGSNWMDCKVETRSCGQGSSRKSVPMDDDRSDKILEIDPGKPYSTTVRRKNLFHSSHLSLNSDQYSHSFTTSRESTAHQTVPSPSSCEVQSLSPLKFAQDLDEGYLCTADNSPQFYSASSKGGSSKRGPFTPAKSDASRSCLSGYSDCPSYMAYTESSKAKVRSLSAPKQRPQYERSSSTKRYSVHGYGESKANPQKLSALHAGYKAYPGSGRLDRYGMPVAVRGDVSGFSGGHWIRY